MHSRSAPAALASALILVAGCGGHGVPPYPPSPVIGEQEPNDSAWQAQGVGPLWAWDALQVAGHAGPGDTDGFAFVAQSNLRVFVELDAANPLADLDLCVWDPFAHSYVLCLTSPGDELGSFAVAAGQEFHLVVDAFLGASSYALFVEAEPAQVGWASDAGDEGRPAEGDAAPASVVVPPEALDFGRLEPARRAAFDRYRHPPERGPALQTVWTPGLPGTPAATLPMLAPMRPARAR